MCQIEEYVSDEDDNNNTKKLDKQIGNVSGI